MLKTTCRVAKPHLINTIMFVLIFCSNTAQAQSDAYEGLSVFSETALERLETIEKTQGSSELQNLRAKITKLRASYQQIASDTREALYRAKNLDCNTDLQNAVMLEWQIGVLKEGVTAGLEEVCLSIDMGNSPYNICVPPFVANTRISELSAHVESLRAGCSKN